MSDVWNKEIILTDEEKQRLGISDAQIAQLEAKKALNQRGLTDYLRTGEQLATSALNGLS